MHIIVIGWLFVALMLAIGERSAIAALLTFTFWGMIPIGLMIWFVGSKYRRKVRQEREQLEDAVPSQAAADEKAKDSL